MTLLDLLSSDGFDLKRKAAISGGEYAGPCPWCGGDDRFVVWPDHPKYKGGRYWCRQCHKSGDIMQYLKELRGMDYRAACKFLGEQPKFRSHSIASLRQAKTPIFPREFISPDTVWQKKAAAFLEGCQSCLLSNEGEGVRAFLHGKGLNDETIKRSGIGWNPTSIFFDRQSWGLSQEVNDHGRPRKLWIPEGLVIPCFENGKVVRLRIRCSDQRDGRRYILVSGSSNQPMVWNLIKMSIIIVESELDGLLLWQETGDLIGVVALGSAQAKPDNKTHEALIKAEKILIALDVDDAGAKAAWHFWLETYGAKAKRWPCVRGKDPSEAYQNGLNIHSWINVGIEGKGISSPVQGGMIVPAEIVERHETFIMKDNSPDSMSHPCFFCGSRNFWLSASGRKWICSVCHPPVDESSVLERRILENIQ